MEMYWSLLCISCLSVWLLRVSGTLFGAGTPNTLEYKNASIGNLARGNVSRYKEEVWLYKYARRNKTTPHAARVTVKSETATEQFPLLFVARLQRGVISWSIPDERYNYHLASRTLCPFLHGFIPLTGLETIESFSIDVSTASPKFVNYTLKAEFADNFLLSLSDPLTVTVDPAQPKYFLWRYPDDVDTVVVRAESEDVELCGILSIQGTECPVYDLARNVEFTGYFQTMTTKAAITMERSRLNQSEFYVVLIVKSSDEECFSRERFTEPRTQRKASSQDSHAGTLSERQKTIKITVEPTLSSKDYVKAIVVPVAFFGSFYVIAFVLILVTWYRQKGGRERSFRSILMPKKTIIPDGSINRPLRTSSSRRSRDHYGSTPQVDELLDNDSVEHSEHDHLATEGSKEPSSTEFEKHYDMLHDIEREKDVYRLGTSLVLTDLAKKEKKYLRKKYRLYHWNLMIIAVFYALPVVQLVITYQEVLNFSGDQDICYYNFFCAHPLGVFSAFNNVFSNIGYVMLGFLFLLLVLRRDRQHKLDVANNSELEKFCGIPQHYAIFYAMGLALIMEGVLSGCYHVCPNKSNFQFDTSFMYIIVCLGIVKLYQTRHPDIAANAHLVYAGFAVIILIAMIGVFCSSFAFWTSFSIIHIFGCLYVSSQIYYMGRVKFDAGMFSRIFILLRYDCCSCPMYKCCHGNGTYVSLIIKELKFVLLTCLLPFLATKGSRVLEEKDRMLLLVIANAVNWVFAIYGVATTPNDFATYLLAILIVNGLLYLAFYVIMKLRNKERILRYPAFYLGSTLVFWIAALILFWQKLESWQKSPALSREGNKDCIMLGFYDSHDAWHFLSACALFLSFLSLLTLDDDLLRTPRSSIPVF